VVRARYREGYPPLDRFDREWYNRGVRSLLPQGKWDTAFAWDLLHAQVINARALYCQVIGEKLSTDDFIAMLVQEYINGL
jgi:hypothetical protein